MRNCRLLDAEKQIHTQNTADCRDFAWKIQKRY